MHVYKQKFWTTRGVGVFNTIIVIETESDLPELARAETVGGGTILLLKSFCPSKMYL